jgi:N-acetylglucosaminyldiphosphoundecaprenol N-acetyl-beta-D-mannosaminyltransferase
MKYHAKNHRYDILGLQVDAITINDSLDIVADQIAIKQGDRSFCMIKPYVEFASKANTDPKVRKILGAMDLVAADGVSLQWAASYLYGKPTTKPNLLKLVRSLFSWVQKATWRNQILPEKFAGITHTVQLFNRAQKEGWSVGVIGGTNPAQVIAGELRKRWPDLDLVEVWSGYSESARAMDFSAWQNDEVLSKVIPEIQAKKLDILCVGMGFPRQEFFMNTFQNAGLAKVMIGEGGSFDYQEMGGSIRRAPAWMRRFGLEWLWRLLRQPSRITRQVAIPRFILAVHRQARGNWHTKSD